MECKEENMLEDSDVPKEEKLCTSNFVIQIKSGISIHSIDEAEENKVTIKEEASALDIGLQNDYGFPFADTVFKNKTDIYGMVSKLEIKEEPWWQEGTSDKVKCQPKVPSISGIEMHSEIKDRANGGTPATELTRLHLDPPSSTCLGKEVEVGTCIFTSADLEEKDSVLHGVKRPYKCAICERSFTQMHHLKNHVLIHEGKRPYKCDICEKRFTQMGSLKMHILIHEGKRPYKCRVCEKSFIRIHYFKSHILVHEGKKPYRCDVCKKSFSWKETLRNHIFSHEGKRPHKCEVCEKSFIRLQHLKSHILIHEGKKPHKCDLCEMSFTQMGHLKKHILIHKNTRPYQCDICGKTFIQMGTLRKHILIHKV